MHPPTPLPLHATLHSVAPAFLRTSDSELSRITKAKSMENILAQPLHSLISNTPDIGGAPTWRAPETPPVGKEHTMAAWNPWQGLDGLSQAIRRAFDEDGGRG